MIDVDDPRRSGYPIQTGWTRIGGNQDGSIFALFYVVTQAWSDFVTFILRAD
jgi:hypothetical protein